MATLTTVTAFVIVTGIVIWIYLRRSDVTEASRPCPRCQAPVTLDRRRCPQCDVPMQAYEVNTAKIVPGDPEGGTSRPEARDGGEKRHAIIRADACVGCATCVAACSVDGAIRLEGKLAVVDPDRCVGAGECAAACPVGGISLGTGDAVHRMEVPDVAPDFQSNVPGVYLAGEVGGRGLIKNAINEGRLAAEAVVREIRALDGQGGPARRTNVFDLIIVGGGPAGLSAALEAAKSGISYVVLEQGSLADSIRRYPRHKLLLAEPLGVPLYGDLWVADATKEALLGMWEATIRKRHLRVRTGYRVSAVHRDGEELLVSGPDFTLRGRRVLLAIGRRGTPRRLGVPGEELPKVFYDIAEMEEFRGRKILVVGGGDSALESAVGLANQANTEVLLSYRGRTFDKAKSRNLEKLNRVESEGKVRVLRDSRVKSITPDEVEIEIDGTIQRYRNDCVIVRIGGEAPTHFLEGLGIRSVTRELSVADAQEAVHA